MFKLILFLFVDIKKINAKVFINTNCGFIHMTDCFLNKTLFWFVEFVEVAV